MDMSRKNKTAEQIVRDIVNPKPARVRKGKSAADVWFEQMKADFVKNGAEHLASAAKKLGK
jgi:hypothetical protein